MTAFIFRKKPRKKPIEYVPTAVILYAAQAHRMLQPWCRDFRNGGGGGGGGTPPVPGPGPDGLRLTPVGE